VKERHPIPRGGECKGDSGAQRGGRGRLALAPCGRCGHNAAREGTPITRRSTTGGGTVSIRALIFDAVSHCNLRCYGCDHFCAFAPRGFASVESLRPDLALLSRYAHVGRFKIVGGEPLLHPRLLDLVRSVRESGLAEEVRIGTNGLLLARQPDAFWRDVDSVVVTVYPASASRLDLALFRRRAERHGTDLVVIRRPLFREPVVDFPIEDARLVRRISTSCVMGRFCHTLKNGRLFRCTVASCIDYYLNRLGYATTFVETDGLRLEERGDMPARIRAYLRSDRPLGACQFCLGSVGPIVPYRQMTTEEIDRPARTRRAEDLVDRTLLRRRLCFWRLWGRLRYVPRPLARRLGATYWRGLMSLLRVPRI